MKLVDKPSKYLGVELGNMNSRVLLFRPVMEKVRN